MSSGRRPSCYVKWFGIVASLSGLLGAACSDDAGDSVERACRVVVDDCDVLSSMSACLDQMGALSVGCIDCIAEGACDYASCERVPGCRIPTSLLPPE